MLASLNSGRIEVTVRDVADPSICFEWMFAANLINAADGMNSAVAPFSLVHLLMHQLIGCVRIPASFAVRAGLCMKVLQFPPAFLIPPLPIHIEWEGIIAICSVN